MATNKFLIFDENGSNIMTDAEYQAATQRIGGVLPGLAEPTMHNKLYRQTSIMAAAIGRVLAQYNLDAPDNDVNTLANNIKSLFCFNVLQAYPVGAIYISASAVNPSQLFGGTWEQIQGKFLLSASSGYPAGTTGGEASHTLTASEMPSHNHTVSVNSNGSHAHTATLTSAGAHTHTASSGSAGAQNITGSITAAGGHTHTRGTMNIIGSITNPKGGGVSDDGPLATTGTSSGALYAIPNGLNGCDGSNSGSADIFFEAARNWTGETSSAGAHSHTLTLNSIGNHSHSVTVNSVSNHNHTANIASNGSHAHTASIGTTGGGSAHNNMPPYLSVYVWKRTA